MPATSTRSLTVAGSLISSFRKNCRLRCFRLSARRFNASAVSDRLDVCPCSSVTTGSPFRMRQLGIRKLTVQQANQSRTSDTIEISNPCTPF
jgi:hypothetical protein